MVNKKQFAIITIINLFIVSAVYSQTIEADWLVTQIKEPIKIEKRSDGKKIILSNGLISRTFRLVPNAATVAYDNLMKGESIIRGVKPEAIVEINGQKYEVGGLQGQVEYAYLLPKWIDSMKSDPNTFRFTSFKVGNIKKRFEWKRKRYSSNVKWPASGKTISLNFNPPNGKLKGLSLSIYYEMYQGIPLLAKWLTIHNSGEKPVRLNTFTSEILAVVEYESMVEQPAQWEYPNIHVDSDYAFHGGDPKSANKTTYWVVDPQ